ncbi:MAG TPA: SRPBCC domain-containing protein [Candidatus Sulfotelmatobacter sp.]|nr:SRPBCC domain-containing protein [Candidatus Sulfotelmatobacter sp.]
MATAAITPDQNTVVAEIFIAAPPARVFEAISDPEQTARWWGKADLYRLTETTADLRPGGKWRSAGVGADGKPFHVEGEYLEIDPPRRLVHTWMGSYSAGLKTVVHWELEPTDIHGLHSSGPKKAGTGTLVRVRQEGFAAAPAQAASHTEGWKRVLGWLEGFVENGETVDSRPSA